MLPMKIGRSLMILLPCLFLANLVSGTVVIPATCDGVICKTAPNLSIPVVNGQLDVQFEIDFPGPVPAHAKPVIQTFIRHSEAPTKMDLVYSSTSSPAVVYLHYDYTMSNEGYEVYGDPGHANSFDGTVWTESAKYCPKTFPAGGSGVTSPLKPWLINSPSFFTVQSGTHTFTLKSGQEAYFDQLTVAFNNAIDPCSPNPCMNGGVCTQNPNPPNYYTCDCSGTGFIGQNCESCVALNTNFYYLTGSNAPGSVVLTTQPAGETVVHLFSDCVSFDKCTFVFTPSNWNIPQTFTVYAVSNHQFQSQPGVGVVVVCPVTAQASSNDLCDGQSASAQAVVNNPQFTPESPRHLGCSTGDPHFHTFDGLTHHFYDIGDFYFARDLEGNFAVQARQSSCFGVSCNTAVAIKYYSVVIYIVVEGGVPIPTVVGDSVGEGIFITGSQGYYIVNLPDDIVITIHCWDFSFVILDICVTLPDSELYRIVGLGGFFTGNPNDDYSLPDGTVTTDMNLFHQSWRVPLGEDLFLSPFVSLPDLTPNFPSNPNPISSSVATCPFPETGIVIPANGQSPLANQPVPFNPNYTQPLCATENQTLLIEAETKCAPYFNDSVAQCCISLGVDPNGPYESCVCDYIFTQGEGFVLSSVDLFNSECFQAELVRQTQCYPCPNACSGHGTCGELGQCNCFGGFTGADCNSNPSIPPLLVSAQQSAGLGCPRTVTLTGNYFYGIHLLCIFDGSIIVNATKVTDFVLTCPIPLAHDQGTVSFTVEVERSDGMISNVLSFNSTPSCCDGLCVHGICTNGGNEGFTCNCTGTGFTGKFCQNGPCPAQHYDHATWPHVDNGRYARGVCDPEYHGTPFRFCGLDGVWFTLVVNVCQRNVCPREIFDNTQWPGTLSTNTAIGECLPGFSGVPHRYCHADGTWGPVISPCIPNVSPTCPVQDDYNHASWPLTLAGDIAAGTCLDGFSGTPFRECLPQGVWSSSVEQTCTRD